MKKNSAVTMKKNSTVTRYEAIYARQSMDKKDSLSIQGQIEKCRSLCDGKLIREYQESGKSGKDTDRPQLQRLLDDVENGNISRVIVYKLDRLSRNIRDFYSMYESFVKHDVAFISVSDNFDTTTPMGRAMMGIVAVFAQMEHETIVLRVKDNYQDRIKDRGSWPSGTPPFGFRIGDNVEKHKTLIPHEEELKAVRIMFKMYASKEGASLTKIRNTLKDMGYRTKTGSVISSSAISKMLQYLVYVHADELLYNYLYSRGFKIVSPIEKWDGSHSAHVIGKYGKSVSTKSNNGEYTAYVTNFSGVVDSSTFIKVIDRLSRNEQLGRGNGISPTGELAGLLKCHHCGYTIKCYKQTLRCAGQVQHKVCKEKYSHIKISELQEKVAEEVQIIIDDSSTRERNATAVNEVYAMGREEFQKQLDNLVTLAALGEETPEVVRKRIDQIQLSIHDIDLRIAMNTVANQIEQVDYISLSPQERKEILKSLVKNVVLHTDGYVDVTWKNHAMQ